MAFAAALSLMRGFLIAGAVSPQNFGYYAALMAVGAFCSNILGWGRIEATRKNFSRQWLDGNAQLIVFAADDLAKTLVVRALIVGVVLSLPIVLSFIALKWFVFVVCGLLVTVVVGWISIYSSAVRATGNLRAMGFATLVRAILALVLGVGAAFTNYWELIIAGEVFAAAVGVWLSRRAAVRAAGRSVRNIGSEKLKNDDPVGGQWLFYAFVASSAPIYLDRLFVASQFNADELGRYSFVMLFVMGAAAVTGIVEQILGPRQIKLQRENFEINAQLTLTVKWMLAQAILVALGMLFATWLLVDGPLAVIGVRYQVDSELMLYTACLSVFQSSVLLDWLLISRDKEKYSFRAALYYLFSVILVFLTVYFFDMSLNSLIGLFAVAKALHIVFLISAASNRVHLLFFR